MGAADHFEVLPWLRPSGLTVTLGARQLLVRPTKFLTDDARSMIRAHRRNIISLLEAGREESACPVRQCGGLAAKTRAKRDGIPFDISSKDIKKPVRCPIFRIRLNCNGTGRGYGAKPDVSSLDRIRPAKGYVRGNVQVVSWRANRAKSHLTPEELIRMSAFCSKFTKK